ncbi:NucA/NucB deoxyribonuclease domain-containing protein [Streptomyces sp. NPDC047980]
MPVHEIDANVHPVMAANFEKATANGAPAILSRWKVSEKLHQRNRNHAQRHAPRPRQFASNATWEEYPFASTYEGGQGATLTLAPGGMNSSHGNALKQFYANTGLQDGMPFLVRVKR